MPSEKTPFTPSSILFRPRPKPRARFAETLVTASGGGAGYRPRVR